jgi:tetratricopeptide (TPR) repeat protein
MKISQENAHAADPELQKLHLRRPELAELAASLAKGSNDVAARRRLAAAYLDEGLLSHAYTLYQELRSEGPGDSAIDVALARIWDAWGNYQSATEHAQDALRLNPGSMEAWDLLARIYLHAGDLQSSRSAWLTALSLQEEDVSALANLGYVFMEERNWEQARLMLERALELDGSLQEARDHLGIVLAQVGDEEGALQQFARTNGLAAAYNNVGVVQLNQGLWGESAKSFWQALTIQPGYQIARENLKEAEAHLPRPSIIDLPPFGPPEPLQVVDAGPNTTAEAAVAASPVVTSEIDGQNDADGLSIPAAACVETKFPVASAKTETQTPISPQGAAETSEHRQRPEAPVPATSEAQHWSVPSIAYWALGLLGIGVGVRARKKSEMAFIAILSGLVGASITVLLQNLG